MTSTDVEMGHQDSSAMAETSKAGAKRMRRLLTPPKLNGPTRSIITSQSSQLIYSTPSSSPYSGHLITPLFKHSAPKPLLPPNLPPSTLISTSYSGEWIIIFHPSQDLSVSGGLIAVYSSSILSPASKNVVPSYSFPLPQAPLAIQHLYPPRQYLINGKRTEYAGPSRPKDYQSSSGPAFVVLSPTTVVLFHHNPQAGNPNAGGQGSLSVLSGPIKTRFYATIGSDRSLESSAIDRGWMSIVEGDDGVWVGWESRGEIGVSRLEVKMSNGNLTLSTIPMPTFPGGNVPENPTDDKSSTICRTEVQGMTFIRVPNEHQTEIDKRSNRRCVIGAAIIYSDTVKNDELSNEQHLLRSRVEIIGFERREVLLVEGFSEIGNGNGNGEDLPSAAWDWFTIPTPISTSISPTSHSIISISSTPLISSTLITALLTTPDGLQLIYLNLYPSDSKWDSQLIAKLPQQNIYDIQIVPNYSVQLGCIGFIALISPDSGARLVVAPAYHQRSSNIMEGKKEEEEGLQSLVKVTANGILASLKQEMGYGDLIRAFIASVALDNRNQAISNLLPESFRMFEDDLSVDENIEIHKLQIALFASIGDPRYALSAEILRLYEITQIFLSCRIINNESSISYHLNSIWSLVSISEWAISTLSEIFKDISILKSSLSWYPTQLDQSSTNTKTQDLLENQISPRLIYILLPSLRFLILQILGYLKEFRRFVLENLDKPIIQPESKYNVLGKIPDPRATILVKERIKDLGDSQGLDIDLWGNALHKLISKLSEDSDSEVKIENSKGIKEGEMDLLLNLIIDLKENVNENGKENGNVQIDYLKKLTDDLPDSASLFLHSESEEDLKRVIYDAITFNPIPESHTKGQSGQIGQMGIEMFKCDCCSWKTISLGYESSNNIDLNLGMGSVGINTVDDSQNGFSLWRKEREKRCGCGGVWLRDLYRE